MSVEYGLSSQYWLKKWFLSEKHRKMLDNIPANSSVLDIGCGGGRVSLYLSSRGIDVTGIDSDTTLISNLQREHPSTKWLCGDAEIAEWPATDWAVSNVCIRKDQCRLELILTRLTGKKLLLRIQGSMDLSGYVEETPCYSQEDLLRLLPNCEMVVESYQQRFTSGDYLRSSIQKIGMTPSSKAVGKKTINANREYLLLRRM